MILTVHVFTNAISSPSKIKRTAFNLIAEIYLYSVGFSEARILAKKIVSSLRLSS